MPLFRLALHVDMKCLLARETTHSTDSILNSEGNVSRALQQKLVNATTQVVDFHFRSLHSSFGPLSRDRGILDFQPHYPRKCLELRPIRPLPIAMKCPLYVWLGAILAASCFLSSIVVVAGFDCSTVTCSGPAENDADLTFQYGPAETGGYKDQVADVYVPPNAGPEGPIPVVFLVHGGCYQNFYERASENGSSMKPLAQDLQERGLIAVNLEFRRASPSDGGFPQTFYDMITGVDAIQCLQSECGLEVEPDLDRVIVAGHSSGGHLALWRALEFGIGDNNKEGNSDDVDPDHIIPLGAVGLAALTDYQSIGGSCGSSRSCAGMSTRVNCPSCRAITDFLQQGGLFPDITVDDLPEAYSPRAMLGPANAAASCPLHFHLAHGEFDSIVYSGQSCTFKAAASTLPLINVEFTPAASEDHFDIIDPRSKSWRSGVIPFLQQTFSKPTCSVEFSQDEVRESTSFRSDFPSMDVSVAPTSFPSSPGSDEDTEAPSIMLETMPSMELSAYPSINVEQMVDAVIVERISDNSFNENVTSNSCTFIRSTTGIFAAFLTTFISLGGSVQ